MNADGEFRARSALFIHLAVGLQQQLPVECHAAGRRLERCSLVRYSGSDSRAIGWAQAYGVSSQETGGEVCPSCRTPPSDLVLCRRRAQPVDRGRPWATVSLPHQRGSFWWIIPWGGGGWGHAFTAMPSWTPFFAGVAFGSLRRAVVTTGSASGQANFGGGTDRNGGRGKHGRDRSSRSSPRPETYALGEQLRLDRSAKRDHDRRLQQHRHRDRAVSPGKRRLPGAERAHQRGRLLLRGEAHQRGHRGMEQGVCAHEHWRQAVDPSPWPRTPRGTSSSPAT